MKISGGFALVAAHENPDYSVESSAVYGSAIFFSANFIKRNQGISSTALPLMALVKGPLPHEKCNLNYIIELDNERLEYFFPETVLRTVCAQLESSLLEKHSSCLKTMPTDGL